MKDAQFPRIIASLTRGCVLKIPGTIYMRSTLGPQGKCVLFAGSFLTRGSLNVRLTAVGVPLSVCVVYTNESILSWPPIQMDALLPFAHLLRLTNIWKKVRFGREGNSPCPRTGAAGYATQRPANAYRDVSPMPMIHQHTLRCGRACGQEVKNKRPRVSGEIRYYLKRPRRGRWSPNTLCAHDSALYGEVRVILGQRETVHDFTGGNNYPMEIQLHGHRNRHEPFTQSKQGFGHV